MAKDEISQSLLLDVKDSSLDFIKKEVFLRKKHRHYASAPLIDEGSKERSGILSFINLESILAQQSSRHVFFLLAAYLGIGTLCFFLIRNQLEGKKPIGVIDAIYFSVVTMTTVGYGDIVPHSALAKLLACVYVFAGMLLVGLILGKAADYMLEKQEVHLVRAMNMKAKFGQTEILKEVEINRVKYKFINATLLLLMLIIIGTLFLCMVEEMDIIDAFYCVCSTTTTLGYGDKSFSTEAGRIFAVFWILSSTVCLAQFFLYLAELYTGKRQRSLVKRVLTRKLTFTDLEQADLDQDDVVSPAEFIVYKLKEMEKITQEDITLLMERFKNLDVNQSGTLTAADLVSSEAS
ncbi:hypothetical protein SLE2022_367950 [Rubroshorea leprosula]